MAAAACAVKGCNFKAGSVGAGLLCSRCAGEADAADAFAALAALEGHVSAGARRQWALELAAGEAGAKELLLEVAAARGRSEARPLIVVQPPARVAGGTGPAGTLTLACEAVSFGAEAPTYQWFKDGQPVPRAQRSRLVLCCAGPADEGGYACEARNSAGAVLSRVAEVRASEASASARSRFEALLRQAAEAAAGGGAMEAERLLGEAVNAAELHSERAHAEARCSRAELLLRLERLEEARRDALAAVDLLPGLARAHAVAGAVATRLGNLAEAACSWETADLLGGVPNAAAEAEACRQRLDAFFAEQRKSRKDAAPPPSGPDEPDPESEEEQEERPTGAEAGDRWRERRRQQWRTAGGRAFGRANAGGGAGGTGGFSRPRPPPLPAELQRHLAVLELAGPGRPWEGRQPPSADEVRRAYRRVALERHPDKGGSKAAFQELQTAYRGALRLLGSA